MLTCLNAHQPYAPIRSDSYLKMPFLQEIPSLLKMSFLMPIQTFGPMLISDEYSWHDEKNLDLLPFSCERVCCEKKFVQLSPTYISNAKHTLSRRAWVSEQNPACTSPSVHGWYVTTRSRGQLALFWLGYVITYCSFSPRGLTQVNLGEKLREVTFEGNEELRYITGKRLFFSVFCGLSPCATLYLQPIPIWFVVDPFICAERAIKSRDTHVGVFF